MKTKIPTVGGPSLGTLRVAVNKIRGLVHEDGSPLQADEVPDL